MPQARLRALHRLIAGLLERPEPGQLVIGCTDLETLHLTRILERLTHQRPTDRVIVHTAPCIDATTYLDPLTPQPVPEDISPKLLLDNLLSTIPAPFRLVLALVPTTILDREGFAELALQLLDLPCDPRLRLILRDDRLDPRHLDIVAAAPTAHRHAHVFSLPPQPPLAAVQAVLHDRRRPAQERATQLLRLITHELDHHPPAQFLARTDALTHHTPTLLALTLALAADLLHHRGDLDTATTLALTALQHAITARAPPLICHAALTLAELHRARAHLPAADAYYQLAELASSDSETQAHIHRLRAALHELPC